MTTKKKRRKKKKKKRKIMMIRVVLECASYFLKFLLYLDQKVLFSLHYFFWADLFSTYAFTRSHGLCLLPRKPHPPPPPNTLDCSLSILGCQNMLKSRRKSMKEEPEVIHTWVEVFPTSSHPLGWLFFGVWKDMKSKSHPFREAVRSR